MKKLMRSVSLLLASLMTMALFTGCGTSNADVLGQQYVQAYLDGFNSVRTTDDLPNDPTLEARCLALLENIDTKTCTVKVDKASVWEDYEDQQGFCIHIDIKNIGDYDDQTKSYPVAAVTEETIAKLTAYYKKISSDREYVQRASNCLGIAAAYKVINGKAYVAVAYIWDERA